MLIKNFKRINYLKFNLTETKFILNKDYFERKDLIEALKNLFANKKTNPESIIKWTEFDTMHDLKNTRLIVVPSIIDFQKDFLNGSKSLFKDLLVEIVTLLEMQNSNLIEIQNLLFSFKLEQELPLFNDLLKKLKENFGWRIESYFSKSISQIIADYYALEMIDGGEKITEDNISLINLKKVYLYFLDCLQKCSEDNLLLIFDDPLNGLNYSETTEMLDLLTRFKSKIIISGYLPKLDDGNLPNLCLWNKEWFLDFSDIFNDFGQYQKFIDTPIEKIIGQTLGKIQQSFNVYDQSHKKYLKFEEKDAETIWKVLINQI